MGNVDVFGQRLDDGFFAGSGTGPGSSDGKPEFVICRSTPASGDVEVSRG